PPAASRRRGRWPLPCRWPEPGRERRSDTPRGRRARGFFSRDWGTTMDISAEMVRKLREETGAGIMDCKAALAECGGDVEKARDALRKKGLAAAAKKAGRTASEGMIGSYIHPG